jgi:C4-dicarboxylate transporter, DctM subunit
MAVILVVTFIALAALGVPIAFSMGLAGAAAIAYQGRLPPEIMIQRMFGGIDSFPLLAVPFFIMAGALMDTGGIALRLIRLAQALVGHVRGGLAMVVVISEIFFSGISGSTVADTSAIGSMMIPALKKAGYTPARAASIVAAASSMGALIPPCIAMVVLGAIANISVGALFAAGFLPAFVMAAGLLILIYFQAGRGDIPAATERPSARRLLRAAADALLALLMPVIIFGGILGGVTTPTEASVVAVLYGLIVGVFVYREIRWKQLVQILEQTLVLTGVTMLLVGGASLFSWLISSERVPDAIAAFMLDVSSTPAIFLALSAVIFILIGMALEGLPAVILLVPILLPAATRLGVDPLHYSIVAIGAVYIGLFLPPAGLGLLLSCGIAQVKLEETLRPYLPYLLVLVVALVVIMYVPEITLVVPRLVFGRT